MLVSKPEKQDDTADIPTTEGPTTTSIIEQRLNNLEAAIDKITSIIETVAISDHTTNGNSETRKRKHKFVPLHLNIISSPKTHTRFYIIKVGVENKTSIDPFTQEDQITNLTGSITTSVRESFEWKLAVGRRVRRC